MGELDVLTAHTVSDKIKKIFEEHGVELKTGHSKMIWDKDNERETKAAEVHFNALIKEGFLAFKVKEDGEPGEKITKFDKNLGKIIMTPMLAGG